MIKRSRSIVALGMASVLLVAACGDDEAEETVDDIEESAEDAAEDAADEAEDMADDAEGAAEDMADEAEDMADDAADEADDAADDMADGDAEQVLLIWADENRVGPIQDVSAAFTDATGVEVQVELVTNETMRDQVSQAGPAGEGPDIFVGAHDWTGELAANGVIDAIDVSAQQDSFVQVGLDAFNFEGNVYAVPYAIEAVALYRNVELVPDAPATWDDLLAACDGIDVEACVVVPGGGDAPDAYHNYPFVSAYGGYIFGYDPATGFDASDVGLDSAEAVQGIEFLQAQVEAGTIPATNYDGAKNRFLEGEAAFWITGPWELNGYSGPDFEVSKIPAIGDSAVQPFVGAQGFYLSAFAADPLIAQSFLLDYVASDDVMQALYDADPRGPAWQPTQDALADDPVASVFAASAADGIPMPNIPQMNSVWGPLGDNVLLVRNGELTGAEAMSAAAEAVRGAVTG